MSVHGISCAAGSFLQAVLLIMAPSLVPLIWIIGKSGKEQERPWCGPGEANIRTSFCLRNEISIKGAVHIVGESIQ